MALTYAVLIVSRCRESLLAYAAPAVDAEGRCAGVVCCGAGLRWRAVEGCGAAGFAGSDARAVVSSCSGKAGWESGVDD